MASADLDRLRMIVTGGASGIGLAVTEAALARGATVCVLDVDPTNTPSGATGIVTDVADDESAAAAVAHAAEVMDGIDIVVNNAGIGAQGTVETNTIDEWRHVFDVNVFGIVRITAPRCPTSGDPRARRWSTRARSRRQRASPTGRCTARPKAPCSH